MSKKFFKETFTIEGKPQGKARPRFTKRRNKTRCYTPKKTVDYEELVKYEYIRQCKSYYFGDDTALCVLINIFYPIANNTKKSIKKDMVEEIIRPTKKPDIDNVIKIICDSLNGIAYKDDAQIVELNTYKYYSDNPRVEVNIGEVE